MKCLFILVSGNAKHLLLSVPYRGNMLENRASNGAKSLRALDGHKIAKI